MRAPRHLRVNFPLKSQFPRQNSHRLLAYQIFQIAVTRVKWERKLDTAAESRKSYKIGSSKACGDSKKNNGGYHKGV